MQPSVQVAQRFQHMFIAHVLCKANASLDEVLLTSIVSLLRSL